MPRRPLTFVALLLAVALGAGCAEDVAPAVRIGGTIEVSDDDLLAEVEEWAKSASLLELFGITSAEGAGPGSYSMTLVDAVLGTRIGFEAHNAQFDELGLELSDEDLAAQRTQLETLLAELTPAYGDRLLADVARQNAVNQNMAPEAYAEWTAETFADVDVNPRYGSWNPQGAAVIPPDAPQSPSGSVFAEL